MKIGAVRTVATLLLLCATTSTAQRPAPTMPERYAAIGVFIGSIEEGARIFTPTRLLPLDHPEAGGHQFPTVLQLHGSEFPLLVWLGARAGYQLWPTLERYPTEPASDWPYRGFRPPPDTSALARVPIARSAQSVAPLPGLRAALFDGRALIAFIVDTRGFSLAERGMSRATSMGLDVSRSEFLSRIEKAAPRDAKGLALAIFSPDAPVSRSSADSGTRLAAEYLSRSDTGSGGVVHVRLTSHSPEPLLTAVDVRAEPGMWLRPNWERTYFFRLSPHETRIVDVAYVFPRRSPEGSLRTIVGIPEERPDHAIQIPEPVLVRTQDAGESSDAKAFIARFAQKRTAHLTLFALRGTPGANDLERIGTEREAAVEKLTSFLGVDAPGGIRIVLYPDSATKTTDTRHSGSGWASGKTIVEIYNASTRVDPYHELTHIVSGQLGGPPALFDEGLATYASERFGDDALRLLGWPGKPVDRVACELAHSNELIPVSELFDFTDIGSAESRPRVAYPEAASIVKFLVEHYGVARFRDAFRTLMSSDEQDDRARNRVAFARIFGASLGDVERTWRTEIDRACAR